MATPEATAPRLKLLVSSAVHQVNWINTLRSAALEAGIALTVTAGCEQPQLSPACLLADSAIALPPVTSPDFVAHLLDACQKLGVALLIPGSPREVLKLASARAAFQALGVRVAVPDRRFVDVTRDPLAVDRLAVRAGAASRGLYERAEVSRRPRAHRWPMDVVPRRWLDEQLDTLRLTHPRELIRVPKRAPVLLTSARTGQRIVVAAWFDDYGRLEWRGAMRAGPLAGGDVVFAETIRDNGATALVDRLAAHMCAARGPMTFQFREVGEGGLVLQSVIPLLPRELALVERAGAMLAQRLLLYGMGGAPRPAGSWQVGMRVLFYPAPLLLVQAPAVASASAH